MHLALVLLLSVVLFLVAAKSHGRQVRLERELEGHHHVVFGGKNHEWVDALWRRDRRRFWTLTPVLAVVLGAGLFGNGAAPTLTDSISGDRWLTLAIGSVLWAPIVSFVVLGTLSTVRLNSSLADPSKTGGGLLEGAQRIEWARNALTGSVRWWTGVIFLIVCVVLILCQS